MPRRARLGIGYLSGTSVFRQPSVMENLEIARTPIWQQGAPDRRDQLIDQFISLFMDRRGYQPSGGERRCCEVVLWRSVETASPSAVGRTFAGVDPLAVADLQALIQSLRSLGMGVLITDHNVREILAITDRAYILNDGSILASGQSETVARSPGPSLPRGERPV